MIQYILREITEDDKALIFNSFLKSYHKSSVCKFVPNSLYYKPQTAIINFIIDNTKSLVLCFPEEPSEIIGYVLYEYVNDTLVVHYVYIKNLYRRQNIARDLILQLAEDNLIIATHITDEFSTLRYKLDNKRIVYDPFYITNKRLLANS